MIESYEDLYQTVQAGIANYKQAADEAANIEFVKNDNGSCTMVNKDNGKKFVLMFARFGDEYKVGFAFYEPAPFGGEGDVAWIEDLSNEEFSEKSVQILIAEHLIDDQVM